MLLNYFIKSFSHPAQTGFPLLFAGLLTCLVCVPTAEAKKFYTWVDEDGNVHMSDRVPPEAIKGAHDVVNEKGIVVEKKSAAKTAEEIEKERELERLRKEKEAVIKRQEAKDQVLVRTFRSEDDLILARDGKLRSVDNYIEITKGNIKRFKDKLSIMQAQAADLEKTGQKVSKKFSDDMEGLKRQINQSYASIVAREQTKDDIRRSYQQDIERFRVLKKLSVNTEQEEQDRARAELNTVFACEDVIQCDEAWDRAISYVKEHATTRLQLLGPNIYMTSAPTEDLDVSLTVARIKDKETQVETIFLDQQCRISLLGEEFCESETSLAIKRDFLPTLYRHVKQELGAAGSPSPSPAPSVPAAVAEEANTTAGN